MSKAIFEGTFGAFFEVHGRRWNLDQVYNAVLESYVMNRRIKRNQFGEFASRAETQAYGAWLQVAMAAVLAQNPSLNAGAPQPGDADIIYGKMIKQI